MKNTKPSLADLDRQSIAAWRAGRIGDAMALCAQMIRLAPTNDVYPMRYAHFAENTSVKNHDPDIKRTLTTCLKTPGIEYQKMASLWASLLTTGPVYAFLFDSTLDDTRLVSRAESLCHDDFFLLGLQKLIPLSAGVEKGLIRLRRSLLTARAEGRLKGKYLPLLCALATQCFYNEYCWMVDAEETALLETLTLEDAGDIALLGCYRPLAGHAAADTWLDTYNKEPLAGVLRIQIAHTRAEQALFGSISGFSAIVEDTSRAVQSMYEENPYPRWHSMDMPRTTFPQVELDWLTAGCGTGRSLSQIAACYPHARITAIDLSRASIAYAIRQTRELGLQNITFRHGDILDAGNLGQQFDFIESSGVLHHMKDPVAGWKALLGCLKPGGRMQIGLYSKTARDVVLRVRDYIKEKGYAPDIDGIRRLRADMMDLPDEHPLKPITLRRDFFSTSECRDLVFHIQEYNYTLPGLAGILDALGLAFLGFKVSPQKADLYARRFPQDPMKLNLDNWHVLEQENPLLFIGMYNFFCCRKEERDTPRPEWVTLNETGILANG